MKKNAKEYLKEFAITQPGWLKALIYEVIETNGDISSEKKDELFNCLKNNTSIVINEPTINDDSDKEIHLLSLEHIKGVNALKQNQIVKFHSDLTILYGLNGAGKSSYFRVLNEIVGGNQKKEILSNIYLDSPQTLDVKIAFKEKGGEKQTIKWDGNSRSLGLLNKCRVFDYSYLNGLLETRKADTTLIQPLGLNLFSYLVDLIDEFKNKLNSDADKKRLEKPILEYKYLSSEIKNNFETHHLDKDREEQIKDFFDFSDEKSKQLNSIEKEISELKQLNIEDKIKLKKNDKKDIDFIKEYLVSTHNTISVLFESMQNELKNLNKNKEANDLAKSQFEILSTIPKNSTSEWKEFIKAGEKYKLDIDDKDQVCVYCRQPLQDENAIKLLNAYGVFLKDESEQKLIETLKQLDDIDNKVEMLSTELKIEENIQEILKENQIEDVGKNLHEIIVTTNNEFTLEKVKLNKKIKKQDLELKNNLPDIKNITDKLDYISEELEKETNKLLEDSGEKNSKIKILESTLEKLQENKSISLQKHKILDWFKANEVEKSLRSKSSKINTIKITTLSKKAHNDLLTETLKRYFTDELKSLGYSNLSVKLENAKGGKGTSSTKLTLSKNNNIKLIFSEGEQKAVALALFIAESKIQKSKNPIILDDPVNSLDHRIAGKFSQRLLRLSNQVILFNHNRLFLDAFETSKEHHICKTIDTECNKTKGKHIRVYQINSEGKNVKGVLTNYKTNKAREHIKKVKNLLNKSPFEDELNVASLLRRTVECVIDEVIFNNQLPTKYSNKDSRISWGELKKLKNDVDIIDKLEAIHGRVSGGEMHNGRENAENPIEIEEFNIMISDIENILI